MNLCNQTAILFWMVDITTQETTLKCSHSEKCMQHYISCDENMNLYSPTLPAVILQQQKLFPLRAFTHTFSRV